jgi:hypothetical protein
MQIEELKTFKYKKQNTTIIEKKFTELYSLIKVLKNENKENKDQILSIVDSNKESIKELQK